MHYHAAGKRTDGRETRERMRKLAKTLLNILVVCAVLVLAASVLRIYHASSHVAATGTVSTGASTAVTGNTSAHERFVQMLDEGTGPRVMRPAQTPDAPYESYYYYQQLSAVEQSGYRTIYETMYLRAPRARVEGLSGEGVERVYRCVVEDCPEFAYLVPGCTYSMAGTGSMLAFTYLADEQGIQQQVDELNAVLDEMTTTADGLGTTEEKLRWFHDALSLRTAYDDEAAQSVLSAQAIETTFPHVESAYGALVEGEAVCGGYASAFEYLCHLSGIPCIYVTGTATIDVASGGHAWNLVEVDGTWSVVDATWDDDDNQATEQRYDFFLVSDAEHDQNIDSHDLLTAIPEGEQIDCASNYLCKACMSGSMSVGILLVA